ncbi:phage protein Gp37 [Neptuniibacter marinus]|uniref:phage protein Gp37 n=1 Tax=Neptuniibacter marinus TaxID=1806670 RepID=UPI003B58FF5D
MLQAVETALISAIKNALGNSVKKIETHPGHWGAQTIKHMVMAAPSVFVGFSTGTHIDSSPDQLKGQWHVYLVGRALNGQREVGIYQMLERLLPALHGLDLGQADALAFLRVKNLFSFAEGKQGVCCYEMTFTLPMNWPDQQDASSLDDWLRYQADHYDENDSTHLMAADTVEITAS